MGIQRSKHSSKHSSVILTGLDSAGKTTLLNALKTGELTSNLITIGLMNETASLAAFPFSITNFDLGGRGKIRAVLRHFYYHCQAVIFVLDSQDERMTEDKYEANSAELHLKQLTMEDELKGKPFLIVVSKSDLPNTCSTEVIRQTMHLDKLLKKDQYHIVSTNMKDGFRTMVEDGLPWLQRRIHKGKSGLQMDNGNNNHSDSVQTDTETTESTSATTSSPVKVSTPINNDSNQEEGNTYQTKSVPKSNMQTGAHTRRANEGAIMKLWSAFKKIV